MKIFFDHQIFSNQPYGGISRYYTELLTHINDSDSDSAILPIILSNNVHLKESRISSQSYFPERDVFKKNQTINYVNKIYTIEKLKQSTYDIFHPTYYDPYFLSYIKKHPFVVTFLDMIHEKFGDKFQELAYDGAITKQKKLLADKADYIISISESTKKDLVDLLKIDPAKVHVIYLGNSLHPNETEFQYAETAPYILYVGKRDAYKNFPTFLSAVNPLLKKYKMLLVCAGGGNFTSTENNLINSLKLSDLVTFKPINDVNLQSLYRSARAFIFPSIYEGFGIPILEAFACDCPCILSNASSFPEVAEEAAIYFDPISEESIMQAVERVIVDDELRTDLIQKGRQRLKMFSWEETARQTLALYQKCL